MAFIATGAQLRDYPHVKKSMFQMRKKIFKDQLGWDVECDGDEEYDEYDHDGTVYVLQVQNNEVLGAWRMLPTTGSYMLADIWPDYADGYLPRDRGAWELSRWAVDHSKIGKGQFERVAAEMFCTLSEFCLLNAIDEVIMLQDPQITPLSTQIFGIPHIRTQGRSAGKSNAHVVSFRPAFRQQLRQAVQLFGFKTPVTDAFDLRASEQMQIAAE